MALCGKYQRTENLEPYLLVLALTKSLSELTDSFYSLDLFFICEVEILSYLTF